jgi:hypothetical protein
MKIILCLVKSAIEIAQKNPDYDMEQVCVSAQLENDIY